jgi:hypothetical protein
MTDRALLSWRKDKEQHVCDSNSAETWVTVGHPHKSDSEPALKLIVRSRNDFPSKPTILSDFDEPATRKNRNEKATLRAAKGAQKAPHGAFTQRKSRTY